MNIEITTSWEKCIYERDMCRLIKDRGCTYHPSAYDVAPEEFEKMKDETFYAIWGSDIPKAVINSFGCHEKIYKETPYTFFRDSNGKIHPIRASYARKTLQNFARQERKFGHLRPEND